MIAGHFGFAAAVKGKAPTVPLWMLMLATEWLEIVFLPLFALGIERLEPVAGSKAGAYGDALIYADYSHSLAGALVLSLIFGALATYRYGKKSGFILGLVAFSHWILDLLVHRSDMPILPGAIGNLPRLGFGLWQYHSISEVVELLIVAVGTLLYWRAARRVAGKNPEQIHRADLCGGAIFLAGALTLSLNILGI
jgi:hypothetical protein